MKYQLRQTTTAGFTLLETLVVILMVGILAAIAAPTWGGIAASRRADMAQNEILQTLRQAQADAIRTRSPQTVAFNTATPPSVQVNSNPAVPLGVGSTQGQQTATTLAMTVSSSSSLPNNVVEFDPRGTVTRGANMIITATSPVTNGRRRCVIVATLLGALQTAKDDQCNPT